MKFRKILLILIASLGIGVFFNSNFVSASSWHRSVPKKLIGIWSNKMGKMKWNKKKTLYPENVFYIAKNGVSSDEQDYNNHHKFIQGGCNGTGATNRLYSKYLGHNTYKLKAYLFKTFQYSNTVHYHKKYITFGKYHTRFYRRSHNPASNY